ELKQAAEDVVTRAVELRRQMIGAVLGQFTLESVADRRAAGQLEFHDLLVFARKVLANDAHVRATLRARYTRILLDEFQDTDPIQLELAVRITALDPADEPGRAGPASAP